MRRWHFRDGMSKREIARRTGLSRNTIRRYLNKKIIDPVYPKRVSLSKLDEFKELLDTWFEREAKRPRKQRKTVKQLYEDIVKLGYSGSYDRVAAYARKHREEQLTSNSKHVFVPLTFASGEAFQFDWGENWVHVGQSRTKLQIAHFKLCHSRAVYLRAYFTQSHEMLFDAHNHAFKFFGGVPERGIYDNMKTAVDKVGKGKARQINRRFQAMVSHYLFEAEFCNPAAGWEKGQVEKSVRDTRSKLWSSTPKFAHLEHLNDWLEKQCQHLNKTTLHPEMRPETVESVWLREKRALMKITALFDGFIEYAKRVSSTCLIHFEKCKYSVPAMYANKVVSIRVYPAHLDIVADGRLITTHKRVIIRNNNIKMKTVYDWRHYLTIAQRKPGALRNGAPFVSLPECFKHLQSILLPRPGGDREMVDILSLVLHYEECDVVKAIELALESGHPSKEHVVNCLRRLICPSTPELVDSSYKLNIEPTTDTQRYNRLMGAKNAH